jgi:hypothetical protein
MKDANSNKSEQSEEISANASSNMLDKFDAWFKSNNIVDNLCTYVAFECDSSTNVPQSKQDNSQQRATHLPPSKKMCSGLPSFIESQRQQDIQSDIGCSSSASVDKQANNYECILSLLVKMIYKNKIDSVSFNADQRKEANSFTNPQPLEFEFLKAPSLASATADPLLSFSLTRIGDENDYLLNLLERASNLNNKCRSCIEETLSSLNIMANKKKEVSRSDTPTSPSGEMAACAASLAAATSSETATAADLSVGLNDAVTSKFSPNDDELKYEKKSLIFQLSVFLCFLFIFL